MKYKFALISFLLLLLSFTVSSQPLNNDSTQDEHELTLYIMPTLLPLDWVSPGSLYKSTLSCYLKTMLVSDNYLLGHVAVQLKSSLLNKPLLTAQTSCGMEQKRQLVLKEKIGLGILGAVLQGRMEPSDEVKNKLKVYAQREKLTFIRFKLKEKAARRILDFIKMYSSRMGNNHSQSDYYGGSFWPRYQNEGSGCSAFGIAMLNLGGINLPAFNDWKVTVNIPMELIGGAYNGGKKVKSSHIKKTKKWHDGTGQPNVDFVKYEVYDPSIMFSWVKSRMKEKQSDYTIVQENGVEGLYMDATNVDYDENEPIFSINKEPDLFVSTHLQKHNTSSTPIITQDLSRKMIFPDSLTLESVSWK